MWESASGSIDSIYLREQSVLKKPDLKDYIVHVGRFHKAKRHDILLEAYKKSNITAKLILIGDGSEKENILKTIKKLNLEKKVTLLGFILNPYPIIKNAKFLILTSDYEGFGIVLVEALILNTPIISTNCVSGPSEILVDEYSQYLMEVNNINNIASKIKNIYNNPYEIDSKILKKFDKVIITNKYLKLMNEQ